MNFYDAYLLFLLATKLWFVVVVIQNRRNPSEQTKKHVDNSDIVFKIGVSILMIYLFRPNAPVPVKIEKETKVFLFAFAILTVFDFFKENKEAKKETEEE
jgi:hypothetical protein